MQVFRVKYCDFLLLEGWSNEELKIEYVIICVGITQQKFNSYVRIKSVMAENLEEYLFRKTARKSTQVLIQRSVPFQSNTCILLYVLEGYFP